MSNRDLIAEYEVLKGNYDRAREGLISAEASVKSKKEALDKVLESLKAKGISSIEDLKVKSVALEKEMAESMDGIKAKLGEII